MVTKKPTETDKPDQILFIAKSTKLAKNSPLSESLKTTIPKEIVNTLKLKQGDEIVWTIRQNIDTDEKGNVIVVGFYFAIQTKEQYLKDHERILKRGSIIVHDFREKK
jgi:bifunctional DNA-binding transcriptional regulator/antitoxin component of YhaV-PrlF toxin-antitoxin module